MSKFESQIINLQNKYSGGYKHKCKNCGSSIYLSEHDEYAGICPSCGTKVNIHTMDVQETIGISTGGITGVGKRIIHKKHLFWFALWWLVSAVVSTLVAGLPGIGLSLLINVLLTIIGFKAFRYEIENERF